jgi:hypothetical protein
LSFRKFRVFGQALIRSARNSPASHFLLMALYDLLTRLAIGL